MTQSSAQADAFYREVLKSGSVWTVRDAGGTPAPRNADAQRAMPFWSSRSRVDNVIDSVADYANFEPVEIDLAGWRSRWLPGLAEDGLLVGINWSGARATGYDMSPEDVERNLASRDQ